MERFATGTSGDLVLTADGAPGDARASPSASRSDGVISWAADYRVFLALSAAGAVLRGLTTVAYRPAMAFVQDTFDYLGDARELVPGVIRPWATRSSSAACR